MSAMQRTIIISVVGSVVAAIVVKQLEKRGIL
jgi:hypothetical protein